VVYSVPMFAPVRRWGSACGVLAALAWPLAVVAQTPKPAPPAQGQQFAIPGSRDSASSGRKEPAPATGKKSKRHGRDAKPRPGAPVATFPGFRLLPSGGSRIYVELTKSLNVDLRKANGTLVYTLRGAQVLSRNNKNALITTHFPTPVARARLLPAGLDVELVIDLRKGVEATHQIVAGENGSARLEIDFPPGDYPPAPGLFEPRAGARKSGETPDEGYDEAPESIPPKQPGPADTGNNGAGPPTP
jgi:hypothetical protein